MSMQLISLKNIMLAGGALVCGMAGGYYFGHFQDVPSSHSSSKKEAIQLAGNPTLPAVPAHTAPTTPPQQTSALTPQIKPEQLQKFWSECHDKSAKKRVHGCAILLKNASLDTEGKKAAKTNLAFAYLELEKFEPAIENLGELLKLYPKDLNLLGSRADTYQMMEKYDLAARDYTAALALSQKKAVFLAGRAWSYFGQNNIPDALKDISKAIQLEKREASHYLTRGQFYEADNQIKKALRDYKKALKLNSRLQEARKAIKRLKVSRKTRRKSKNSTR